MMSLSVPFLHGKIPLPKVVNLAILTYNALGYTKMCLDAIRQNTAAPINIFIYDNLSSKDDTRTWLSTITDENIFVVLGDKNYGVPGGRNKLIEAALPHMPTDAYLVFMDNDIELKPGWDHISLLFLRDHPNAGITSVNGHSIRLRYPSRELLQPPTVTSRVDIAAGGFVCWISRKCLEAVKEFDEKLGIFWHEDDDFSIRARSKGFDVYCLPHIPCVHHEHKSSIPTKNEVENDGSPKNQAYLVEKWTRDGTITFDGKMPVYQPGTDETFARRMLLPNVYVAGASPNQGGYYWLAPMTVFTLDGPGSFEVTLTSPPLQSHMKFPFTYRISTQGGFELAGSFTKPSEEVTIEIPISSGPDSISIESSSCFSPVACGWGTEFSRPLSMMLIGYQVKSGMVSSPTYAPKVSFPKVHEGILITGPILEETEGGELSTRLVSNLSWLYPGKVQFIATQSNETVAVHTTPLTMAALIPQIQGLTVESGLHIDVVDSSNPSFPRHGPEFYSIAVVPSGYIDLITNDFLNNYKLLFVPNAKAASQLKIRGFNNIEILPELATLATTRLKMDKQGATSHFVTIFANSSQMQLCSTLLLTLSEYLEPNISFAIKVSCPDWSYAPRDWEAQLLPTVQMLKLKQHTVTISNRSTPLVGHLLLNTDIAINLDSSFNWSSIESDARLFNAPHVAVATGKPADEILKLIRTVLAERGQPTPASREAVINFRITCYEQNFIKQLNDNKTWFNQKLPNFTHDRERLNVSSSKPSEPVLQ